MGHYASGGQLAKADCSELVAREVLNALLWDDASQRFDATRLPPTACPALAAFYAVDGPADAQQHARARNLVGPIAASEVFFAMCCNLPPPVQYLSGTADCRYELCPTVDNIAACLGALLGRGDRVGSLEALSAMIRDEFGGAARGMTLHTNSSRARLYVSTACDAKAAEKAAKASGTQRLAAAQQAGATVTRDGAPAKVVVEFVLSIDLNHAFAIHHWTAPPWQTTAAKLALEEFQDGWWERNPRGGGVPRAVLLPALLQPLLASKEGGGKAAIDALTKVGAQQRTRLIRLGMYADSGSEACMAV